MPWGRHLPALCFLDQLVAHEHAIVVEGLAFACGPMDRDLVEDRSPHLVICVGLRPDLFLLYSHHIVEVARLRRQLVPGKDALLVHPASWMVAQGGLA